MSLDNLRSKIQTLTDEEIREFTDEAGEEAGRIVEAAEGQAESIRKEKTRSKGEELVVEEKAELAKAKIDLRKKILEVKDECLRQVFSEAENRLRKIVEGGGKGGYDKVLANLVVEAAARIQGSDFVVMVNPRDKRILAENLQNIKKRIAGIKGGTVEIKLGDQPLKSVGGTIVYTSNMRQYYNNTFEAHLMRAQERLRGDLSEILFGRLE